MNNLRSFIGNLTLCGIIVANLIFANRARAVALEVCPSGCTYSSIQEAVNNAGDGDNILVNDGAYQENINFKDRAITISSKNGPKVTIIDGNHKGSVLTFNSIKNKTIILAGFTIRNGSSVNGGGIYCSSSSPTITNCMVINNSVSNHGGGIYCSSSSPSIINCTITGNFAKSTWGYGGGIYCSSSTPKITNCTIAANSAEGTWAYGGGIASYDNSTPKITNCTIADNSATYNGGGIACYESLPPIVVNTIIWGNKAGYSSSEIYLFSSSIIFFRSSQPLRT